MNWILGLGEDDKNAIILWFYRPTGAGKTAIAHNIAECCDLEHLLLASFFFSQSDPTLSGIHTFFIIYSCFIYMLATSCSHTFTTLYPALYLMSPECTLYILFPHGYPI